jgi:hypothetical protein
MPEISGMGSQGEGRSGGGERVFDVGTVDRVKCIRAIGVKLAKAFVRCLRMSENYFELILDIQ